MDFLSDNQELNNNNNNITTTILTILALLFPHEENQIIINTMDAQNFELLLYYWAVVFARPNTVWVTHRDTGHFFW